MSRSRDPLVRLVAAAALLVATGCGAEIPGTDGAKVSQDGDAFKIETDSGSLESSAALPDDFPKDEVPILDGTIINATSLDTETERGFTVTMKVSAGSVQEAADQGAELLVAAGYEDAGNMSSADLVIVSFENSAWTVSLTATVSDGDPVVSYTVVETPAS